MGGNNNFQLLLPPIGCSKNWKFLLSIHELKLKNRDEIELYKLLKKISKKKGLKLLRKRDCYVLDGRIIEILLHREVRVDGRIFGFSEIEKGW